MDARIAGKLRVESCYQVLALFDQNRVTVIPHQHLGAVSDAANNGGADEDCFHVAGVRARLEVGLRSDAGDTAVHLAAVGVAFHADIDEAETFLRRTRDFVSQKDCSGASAEDGASAAELAQGLHQVLFVQQLEHGGALASRNDQPIEPFQIGCRAHRSRLSSGALDGLGMRVEIALQREHSNLLHGYQPRVCISSPSGIFETSSPAMPIPRPSLASRSLAGSLK